MCTGKWGAHVCAYVGICMCMHMYGLVECACVCARTGRWSVHVYAYVRVGGVCMCMCVYEEVGARV